MIHTYISKFNTKLFADDTVLTLSNSCIKTLQQEVNQKLEEINNWMKLNKLSFNPTKTKYMLIKGRRKSHTSNDCNIHIGKHKLEQVGEIKYLGIMFDDKLTWKPHIKQLCSKLSRGSWAVLKLKNYVNFSALKAVYYSFVYSHLRYCISTWVLVSKTALDPLEKLHKGIIRNLSESPYLADTSSHYFSN